jgi:hypothetical protein
LVAPAGKKVHPTAQFCLGRPQGDRPKTLCGPESGSLQARVGIADEIVMEIEQIELTNRVPEGAIHHVAEFGLWWPGRKKPPMRP